jgi:transcriptional regulator with GAF, ATPase, and Fis domain
MERNREDWLEISELKFGSRYVGGMVVKSAKVKQLFKTISRLGPYKSTVLIEGESGTGKELVAQALHQCGPNRSGPFVIFNCSNLVESLAESQLFGHVKGAFTDARDESIGYFRSADGGTLFLDEIGELPLNLQPKLLRAVESHEVQPVGSSRSHRVDIRLVAATNRELRAMVAAGYFRTDLYYRLNATSIVVPPLRERLEAIDAFTGSFIELYNRDFGKQIKYVSRRALEALSNYQWPGNLREFRHVIESAVMMVEDEYFDIDLLPDYVVEPAPAAVAGSLFDSSNLALAGRLPHQAGQDTTVTAMSYSLNDAIRGALVRALREANGNCHVAARLLGISRYTVYRMMTRYGLGEVRNYRGDSAEGGWKQNSA